MALGVSVASATNEPTINNVPISQVNGASGGTVNITWSGSNELLTPTSSDSTKITNIELLFDRNSTLYNDGVLALRMSSGQTFASTTGLKVGENGTGNFKVQYGQSTNTSVLSFGKSSNEISLQGNLVIFGGKSRYSDDRYLFTDATFAGSLDGNLQIQNYGGATSANRITFTNGNITGNVENDGGVQINLNGASSSILGNISASYANMAAGRTEINFNIGNTSGTIGSTNKKSTITAKNAGENTINFLDTTARTFYADIKHDGGRNVGQVTGGGNFITFAGQTSIVGNISTEPNGNGQINQTKNSITFSGDGAITGYITSADGGVDNNNYGNIITFSGSGTNTIGLSAEDFKKTPDVIVAKAGANADAIGHNRITFSAGSNTITGNILATNTAGNGQVYENRYGQNEIYINGSTNKIDGKIYTTGDKGLNKIELGNKADTSKNTITGQIDAWQGGSNQVTFGQASQSSTNTLGSDSTKSTSIIYATYNGQNNVTFNGTGTATIYGSIEHFGGTDQTAYGNTVTLSNGGTIYGGIKTTSRGAGNADTSYNNVTFAGTGNATIAGDVFSSDGQSTNKGNVITFSGTAQNTIQGNVTSNGSGYDGRGRNEITFSAGSLNAITGDITATNQVGNGTVWKDSGVNIIKINGEKNVIGAVDVSGFNPSVMSTSNIVTSGGGSNNTIELGNKTASTTNWLTGKIDTGDGASAIVKFGDQSKANSSTNTIGVAKAEGEKATDAIYTSRSGRTEVFFYGSSTTAGTTIIHGNIRHIGGGSSYTSLGNDITFENTNATINGGITNQADGTGYLGTTRNSIIFGGDGVINGDIFSDDGNGNASNGNTIAFNGSGSNSIIGTIRSNASAHKGGGKNSITFSNTSATNTITGDIITTDQAVGGEGYYFCNPGSNTISMNGTTNTITGNVYSRSSGNNTITMTGTTSSLTGNITSEGGTNNIKIKGDNKPTSHFLGDITNSGTTNVILDQVVWMPASTPTKAGTQTPSSGHITNTAGTTTLIYRQGATNVLSAGVANFVIDNTAGTTNIITQIGAQGINMASSINYSSGSVNALFAQSNDGDSTTITGGVSNGVSETFTGSNITDISLNKFFGITYKDGVKLALQDTGIQLGNNNTTILKEYASIYGAESAHVNISLDRSGNTDTVTVGGLAVGSISSLDDGANKTTINYIVDLTTTSVFAGGINLDTTQSTVSLTMGQTSKLILTGENNTMKTLTINGSNIDRTQLATLDTLAQTNNTIIDLASGGSDSGSIKTREDFRVLVVGDSTNKTTGTGLQGSGDVAFITYINQNADQSKATIGGTKVSGLSSAYADRIIIKNAGNNDSDLSSIKDNNYYIRMAVDVNSNLKSIKYTDGTNGTASTTHKNIAVATIAKKTNAGTGTDEASIRNMGVITLQEANTLQGFDVLSGTLKAVETDVNGATNGQGQKDYITYFINSLDTAGADTSVQEATATVAAVSLDLYLANFNSLNKRMGELRNNDNSQGVWARVFAGSQSSDFGLGSKTTYVTTQAGYDYAFGFEGANNYLGLALAYSHSTSSMNSVANSFNSNVIEGIEGDLTSDMVEVGIYNSYVQDEGWYNDTIAKFSYIMNDFTQSGTAAGNSVSISNMAFTLSDEFGYRFKLGSEKEWYIDPQLEMALGYVMGTEFTQISGLSTLDTKIDSMMQLRARFGSSFGYDFKKFTQGKPINASVYLGAFYEYDYINGGDSTLTTNLGGVNSVQNAISSDGRVVMNVGTNMTIKDNTRIYFDFESSFAGKINTDYQVNVGVRYSFGENTGYMPSNGSKKEVAPLKISDENAEATQESKESVETQESAKENTPNTQEQNNSTENKAQ